MEETLTVTEISAKGCLNRGTTFRSGNRSSGLTCGTGTGLIQRKTRTSWKAGRCL
ncbi:hypothetical protein DEO72_LG3g2032 [Vigna unguiculata]|uniref:Uncharacterized protein n=1 Tax=Vigna unguiculata TaxID=3917 RepID=A0A4D6LGG1_VIGUN|nr:hypothetical protein DEO72_LG3g2032 [Vigna unguiculata]